MKKPVNTEELRHLNRATVLGALREMKQASHSDIAQNTSLASGTVSVITGELIQEGAIERIETPPPSGRGRPKVIFGLRPGYSHFAIVQITSGSVDYSLVDYCGRLIDRFARPRLEAENSAEGFGHRLRDEIALLAQRSKLAPEDLSALSVSTKGFVDRNQSVLRWSPVLGDQMLDFATILPNKLELPVRLTHETSLVAAAVLRGSPTTVAQNAVLSLGDSIGFGVAQRNAIGEVEHFAPIFAHMVEDPGGPLCRCGAKGCTESFAAFYGILRRAFEAPNSTSPAKFIPIDQMNRIAGQARAGDRRTGLAFREAGRALGLGLARVFSLYGPMPLTITGPGLSFFDLMREGLEENLNNTLQARLGEATQITFQTDEAQIVFDSNVSETLKIFDDEVVSTRRSGGIKLEIVS